MFTVVKVRRDQQPGDYTDPGWYQHPAGTVAYEWTGRAPVATRAAEPAVAAPRRRADGPQAVGAFRAPVADRRHSRRRSHAMRSNTWLPALFSARARCPRRHLRTAPSPAQPKTRALAAEQKPFGIAGDPARVSAHDPRRDDRPDALHAVGHQREAGRDDPLRASERRQGHARDGDRHAGGARSARRADAEVPGHGARRAVHGARRGRASAARSSGSSTAPGEFDFALPHPRPFRGRHGGTINVAAK